MLPCVRRQPRDRLYRTAAAAPLFNYLAPDQSAKENLVSRIFTSWNQLSLWVRQLGDLRRVA
jgi:hypothetical protein